MKSVLSLAFLLSAMTANATGMYEQAYPDLNKDGLRDKVELTQEENGAILVKMYLAKEKYNYSLVSTGDFLAGMDELGVAGDVAHLAINDKKQVIIEQMNGSADRTNLIYTFEFRKNDLYLVEKSVEDLYFGNGSETITDYKTGRITTQAIKNFRNRGPKKVEKLANSQLIPLAEVKSEFAQGN